MKVHEITLFLLRIIFVDSVLIRIILIKTISTKDKTILEGGKVKLSK